MAPESRLNDCWVVLNLNERENERDERGGNATQNRWHLWPCPVRLLDGLLLSVLRAGFYIILNT